MDVYGDVYGLWPSIGYWEALFSWAESHWTSIGASQVLQKPADWICSASDVDKKKGRKLDPNEDLRNKGFKAPGKVERSSPYNRGIPRGMRNPWW